MEVIKIIVTVLEVLASIALVLVVLLQSGKESGLSGAIAGNSNSYMNKSKMGGLDKKLASYTKWIALAWIILTLALSLI
ncbi:MAG: preprotein translocase subunit SecG [Oscillospiraceae bacterium]|nr:preprotein translocase subunit SecG [Oscillospiraceae bacterium]